jgi:hypothetical protein
MVRNARNNNKSIVRVKTAPLARSYQVDTQPPRRTQNNNGKTIIKGVVEFSTVAGSTSFSATRIQMNPGLSHFTGLATEASLYDKYRVRKWNIEYVPSNAVYTTAGIVYLAYDVDSGDGLPTSSSALANYEGSVRDQVYECFKLVVPPHLIHSSGAFKKVRAGPVTNMLDTYDVGNLIVATDDCADTSDLGKLYLEYELEMVNRQFDPVCRIPPNLCIRSMSSGNQSVITGTTVPIDFDREDVLGFPMTEPNADEVYRVPCGAYHIHGEVGILTTTAGGSQIVILELYINDALAVPYQAVRRAWGDLGANAQMMIPYSFFHCDADEFDLEIRISPVYTAGAMTVEGHYTRLIVQAV